MPQDQVPDLTARAKILRKNLTPAEVILWQRLRKGQLNGFKFRRQQPIGPYIVDFFCPALRVVIELDGESHAEKEMSDARRQAWLESQDIIVLRFTNEQVYNSEEGVWQAILKCCLERGAQA